MSLQEIFDTVARHLLTQGKKSLLEVGDIGNGCAYYGPDNLKCAVGALIPEHKYVLDIEGKAPDEVNTLCNMGWNLDEILLLNRLQEIHDDDEPHEWRNELQALAIQRNLASVVLREFAGYEESFDAT